MQKALSSSGDLAASENSFAPKRLFSALLSIKYLSGDFSELQYPAGILKYTLGETTPMDSWAEETIKVQNSQLKFKTLLISN